MEPGGARRRRTHRTVNQQNKITQRSACSNTELSASMEPNVTVDQSFCCIGGVVDSVVMVRAQEYAVVEVGLPSLRPGHPMVCLAPGAGDVAPFGAACLVAE